MRISREDYPRLSHLLGGLYPGCERGVIDPDAMPEAVAEDWTSDEMNEFRAECTRALGVLSSLDVEAGIRWLGLHIALPGGNSALAWLRDLSAHIEEYDRRGRPLTIADDGIMLPRVSAFIDKPTANAASTAVIRTHEATLRAWADDPESPWRLHLYSDLGREVGSVIRREEVDAYQEDQESAPPPTKEPVTGCVVIFRKHPETRAPFVATTYPEISLPADARDRYPDLPLLFGAYLGQDYTEIDHDRWAAERNFNGSTPPDVKARIAEQLEQLLRQDDASLRHDVEALGSYVMPDALRRWVTGLHRRMTRIDWSRPPTTHPPR